jgi:hypothetical protein
MTNQEKVCEVVMKLQEFQTSMVDALLEPLLQDEDGNERTYIQIDRRNDEGNADIFAGIMQDVRTYADTLPDEEASKLETFFAESAVQEPLHAPGMHSMFAGGGEFVGPSAPPALGAGLRYLGKR